MKDKPDQIFYTPSRRRWWFFRGSLWLMTGLILGALTLVGWSIWQRQYPRLPALQDSESQFRALLAKDQEGATALGSRDGVPRHFQFRKPGPVLHQPNQIRAGFYVNWDAQSYQTLVRHIDAMNLVMPEWFFVGNQAELKTDIDAQADSLLKQHPGVAVMPMISNFYNGNWRSANLHKLLSHPARRQMFIGQVVAMLQKHHFQGVNVDFEELREPTDETLTAFVRELHTALTAHGYKITIDIGALNSDYNLPALAPYVNYFMLMAYDQHFSTSAPGPVAPYPWIEYVMQETCKLVPSEKVVLCVAAYGYDWPKNGTGVDVTYQQALGRAHRSSATPIRFDNGTYNLSFKYADADGRPHTVWFNDAASGYNVLRASADYETAGVAIWRLGSEDARMWDFYKRDLSLPALRQSPYAWQRLQTVAALTSVDYQGEGDILDMQAEPQPGRLKLEYNAADQLISEETYLSLPTSYIVRKVGQADKTVVLTFDDGPDEQFTPPVLDILKQEHVPATFFVTGLNAERNLPLLRRIADEGYEIGNHTTLHPDLSQASNQRLFLELNTCRRIIESITGRSTILFRPPYNADSEPGTPGELKPLIQAERENYYTVGESIDPQDWQPGVTAGQIVQRVKQQQNLGNIILLHDAGGDRSATVKALPELIHYYKKLGYHFATVGELMHKSPNEIMPPVNVQTATLLSDRRVAEVVYYGQEWLTWLFLAGTVLAVGRILLVAGLALRQHRQSKQQLRVTKPESVDLVSVIVPAYNEEINAIRTVRSLLASDYPALEILFVDDGSTDNTYERVRAAFASEPRVRVLTKPNGGKASALNFGIARARGTILVCIDADTILLPNAIRCLVAPFADTGLGAVAGNVQVGNAHNALTRFQSIEYVTSQNVDRRAYAVLNCITVVPGAIGAFRRDVVRQVGGFTTDTLAEDCDLTIRILRAGYRVTTANEAIAITEAPETLPMLFKQRVRWCYGIMQTVWKHRDLLFRPGSGALGWLALPSLVVFQFGFPLLTLVAEAQLVLSWLLGTWSHVLIYSLVFLVLDIAVAIIAYSLDVSHQTRHRWSALWWLVPQRLVWRYLLFAVLLQAYLNAIRGEFASWGILKRTGRVTINLPA